MTKVRANAIIRGRVQGVFYRQSTMETARRLNLTGWVRNRPDGSVEATVEGPADAVRDLLKWCKQGPPAAEVNTVDVDWTDATGEFTRFSVR
jgi:acylphosphatase